MTGKKIVRQSTFETNSSSSHSLVISRRIKPKLEQFPRNSKHIYYLEEYGVTWSGECALDVAKLHSEVNKARFMLNIIASHIEEDDDYNKGHYPEVAFWLDGDNPNRTFEALIAQKPFVWFKEVLESHTNTEFEFVEPRGDYFPYYERVCDDRKSLDKAIDIDFFDEKKFKERVAQIIFDEEIIIIDADIPYGCDVDFKSYV